jgi:hypothetical protein
MTIVCLIVSLQLFNISFDPADTFCGPEDLSINEIESCVELVVEKVMSLMKRPTSRDLLLYYFQFLILP